MTEDQQLLHEYATGGSRAALDKLIARHLSLVYSSALRQVRDPHLAEDVTQAVFLILSMKARTIRNRAVVGGWLLTVTRCTSLNAMRKRAIQRKHESRAARPDQAQPEASEREADEWAQIAPFLDAELNRLPGSDRSALILRFFEDRTFAETGAALGISEEAARKRVTRALRRLRQALVRRRRAGTLAGLESALARFAAREVPQHLLSTAIQASTNPSARCLALAKGGLSVLAWTNARLIGTVACPVAITGMILALAWGGASPHNTLAAPPLTVSKVVLLVTDPQGDSASAESTPPAKVNALSAASNPSAAETIYSVSIRFHVDGKPDEVDRLIQSTGGFECRVKADGTREVMDEHTGERVVYDDRAHSAVMTAGTVDPRDDHAYQSMEQRFLKMVKNGARHTGSERIDGRSAKKYVFDEEGSKSSGIQVLPTRNIIWMDKASSDVVRATTTASFGNLKMSTLYSNFEINPDLPANMLSIVPPLDYKVTTPFNCKSGCAMLPDLGAHIEKNLLEIVRDGLRAKNGATRFPEDLNSISGYIRLDNSDVPGVSRSAPPARWFARANIGRSLADLPKDSWGYPGVGRSRGNGDELIFWRKTPDGVKGIFGDLSIKPVDRAVVATQSAAGE